ncbi:MAG: cyclic nucleotide-binding protein [Deltaproteobacteria bacterium HGW-Deltaproteobacteria-15]|jgi:ATP/ADP translocase|nr:MAG: cyclic nucleotide-binding protein [Deltaproteobacteria bacterium HGW-Deltaproteobacteria-15]
MSKFLGRWLKIYEGELSLFFWSTLLFFTIHVSDILLNNFGETAFLKRFGVEYLPVIYMTNAVTTFFLMSFLTGIMARTPSSRLLYYMLIICGTSVGAIRLLIPLGFEMIYPVIYIMKSQYEVLLGLLFWDTANDLFNTRQSKRLFPLLTAGGVLGGVTGSFLTPMVARGIGIDNLMFVYLGTALAGAMVVGRMGSLFPLLNRMESEKKGKKTRSSILNELRKVIPILRESTLAKILVVLTLVPNIVIPIINFEFNFAVDQTFGTEGGMLKFFGYFRGSMNIVSFVLLLFVGRIYGKWGLPIALMFHPINYVIAFLAYLLKFDIFSAMYSQLSTTVLRNTINNPARAVLMGLFPPEHRSVVRPFLRGTVVRIGILLGSGTILLFQGVMHPRYLSIIAIAFVSIWIVTTFILKRRYSAILLDLISRNMLDMKSLEEKDVGHLFLDKKVQSQLVENFLSCKGATCLWYAGLIKSLGLKNLDDHILAVLKNQDEKTAIGLLEIMSGDAGAKAIPLFVDLIKKRSPNLTLATLKAAGRIDPKISGAFLRRAFEAATHPQIKAYAVAGLYSENPQEYDPLILSWLSSAEASEQKAGIISAGKSGNAEFIPPLLHVLQKKQDSSLISLILEALRGLEAEGLNEIALPYLRHDSESVRKSAMESINITEDDSVRAIIPLLGDPSDIVRDQALAKLQDSSYQSGEVLIESLSLPNRRLKEGVFSLLQSLQIRDLDILKFAKSQMVRAYMNVAEVKAIEHLPESPEKKLLADHLLQMKKERADMVLRVLSAQDPTGHLRLIHRGVLSADARQRANAVEAMEDILGSVLSRGMIPLLEDLSPSQCLEAGKKFFEPPRLDSIPEALHAHLLLKKDWVTVILSLSMVEKQGIDILEKIDMEPLLNSGNRFVRESARRYAERSGPHSLQKEQKMETGISIPDKILHLKSIHIFEGLSVSELAAIASVTEEVIFPKGTDIIKEGERGETMYMIIDGGVLVIKGSQGGTEIVLDRIKTGDYFGEMALFEDLLRSASIRTEEDTKVLVLDKREFTEIVREYPLIALQICKVLSQRLRKLHERIQHYEHSPACPDSLPANSGA